MVDFSQRRDRGSKSTVAARVPRRLTRAISFVTERQFSASESGCLLSGRRGTLLLHWFSPFQAVVFGSRLNIDPPLTSRCRSTATPDRAASRICADCHSSRVGSGFSTTALEQFAGYGQRSPPPATQMPFYRAPMVSAQGAIDRGACAHRAAKPR